MNSLNLMDRAQSPRQGCGQHQLDGLHIFIPGGLHDGWPELKRSLPRHAQQLACRPLWTAFSTSTTRQALDSPPGNLDRIQYGQHL